MSAIEALDFSVKNKDGDGSEEIVEFEYMTIAPTSNGWMITTVYNDGSEVIEAFDNDGNDNGNLQTIRAILESMGLQNEIKVK